MVECYLVAETGGLGNRWLAAGSFEPATREAKLRRQDSAYSVRSSARKVLDTSSDRK